MKLYATVTSERASKGQGGNKYLEIELKAFDRVNPIGSILLTVEEDANGKPTQYLLKWQDNTLSPSDDRSGEWQILLEGHKDEGVIQHAEKVSKPYDYSKTPTAKLEKELKEFQVFLSDENSSLGRQDFFMEQAMIRELEKRDKIKGNKQKGEVCEYHGVENCSRCNPHSKHEGDCPREANCEQCRQWLRDNIPF